MKANIQLSPRGTARAADGGIRPLAAVARAFCLLAALFATQPASAQGSFPGCSDVADSEINVTRIVNRAADGVEEPMKLAFESVAAPGQDAKDRVHVYYTERKGRLRKYDAIQKRTLTLAQFPLSVGTTSSDGLMGIALDPGFRTNHQLYLYYTAGSGAAATWRVSRFTLNAAHEVLDMGSERVILDIPIQIGAQHTGGALAMDPSGDLWIAVGDNHLPGGEGFYLHTSANTNDLRGKILRIRPKADGTYDIPSGNLFPQGTARTRPEIYIMGNRNPYTITVDPVRKWLTWGEVGPDDRDMDGNAINGNGQGHLTEEYNLATAAGNYGYPYFTGRNFALKSGIDAAAPAIPSGFDWQGTQPGLTTLPAAIPSIKAYRKSCAITGPIYRYDGSLVSSIKLPPHFHLKWFTTDFNAESRNIINLYTLNANGSAIESEQTVLRSAVLYKPLDMQIGPDGALYVVNYAGYRTVTANTSIVRIEYTGSCRPADITGVMARSGAAPGPRLDVLPGGELSVGVAATGAFTLEVLDIRGRSVASRSGKGESRLRLEEVRNPGVYILRAVSADGVASRKIVRK